MVLLTPEAAVPAVRVPWFVAPAQLKVEIEADAAFTERVNAQLCPPKLNAKLAVPLALGVPVIL